MDLLKIAVIGGGSSYTPELIDGFIKCYNEMKVDEIWLVDIEEGKEKLEIVGNLAKRMISNAKLKTKIVLTTDRKEAIRDASFVLTQLRVGGLDARANDERIPIENGIIGQETTGAGGFAKAIRTIPVILDICKDIKSLSKDAWLINFTNPAGIMAEVVNKYTDVKVIGLCNVPITMKHNIAKALDVAVNRIHIELMGLNHFVWGKRVFLDGKDVTDIVIKKLCDGAGLNMNNIPDLDWDPRLLESLGMVPCPYHRYYYMQEEILKEEIESFRNKGLTRAVEVKEIEKELFDIYKDENLNTKPEQLEKRGGAYYSDAAVSLINSIYNDKKDIHTVNILNNGAITNIDNDVVVEVNAVVGKNGPMPICVGAAPNSIKGLIEVVKSYELLTVRAGVDGDRKAALQALSIHPLIPSFSKADKVLNELIDTNKQYLPQFK